MSVGKQFRMISFAVSFIISRYLQRPVASSGFQVAIEDELGYLSKGHGIFHCRDPARTFAAFCRGRF